MNPLQIKLIHELIDRDISQVVASFQIGTSYPTVKNIVTGQTVSNDTAKKVLAWIENKPERI